MRIPSQFNDSSLYRPRNARGSGCSNQRTDVRRRLIRLTVALLLVIVVMRQAAKPGVYQTFFGSQDRVGWVSTSGSRQTVTPPDRRGDAKRPLGGQVEAAVKTANTPTSGNTADLPVADRSLTASEWDLIVRWVQRMELSLQRAWIEVLLRLRDPEASAEPFRRLTVEQIDRSIAALQAVAKTQSTEGDAVAAEGVVGGNTADAATIIAALQTHRRAAERDAPPDDVDWAMNRWGEGLLDALDEAALARVTDGTFWVGEDSDAFYLMLARAEEVAAEVQQGVRPAAVTTGTVPLLQQPEVYRGKPIRVVGRLQLAEQKAAAENRPGIQEYWKLWVIPDDGGIRPTLLITAGLPDSVHAALSPQGNWNRQADAANPDGKIAAVGRFIKRLPYRSSIGADIAPVVIGDIVAVKGIEASGNTQAAEPADANGDRNGFGPLVGVIAAMLFGVLVAGFLMHRSKQEIQRTRRMRRTAVLPPPAILGEAHHEDIGNDNR